MTPFVDPSSVHLFKNHLNSRNLNIGPTPQTEEDQWKQSHELSQIETLLMLGRREEAVKIAIESNNWSLALLISSVCDKKVYQEVVRAYSDYSFPKTSGLNLLSLIYSNQAENTIRHGGKVFAASGIPQSSFESTWGRNLTAVISNKVDDWSQLARHIGDRVLQESGDILAAHFAFIVSGALFGRSKISLIGALDEVNPKSDGAVVAAGPLNQSISQNAPQYAKKYMGDVRNIAALRMTEIYEWSLEKGLESQINATGTSNSSSVSLVNMLGIRKTEGSEQQGSTLPLARPSAESLLKSRTYLCSYKLRFAIILCDLGLTAQALEYATEIKNFILYVNQKLELPDPKSQKPGKPLTGNMKQAPGSNESSTPVKQQPFSKGFINTVNEFIDRLSGGNVKNTSSSGGQGQNSSSSSGWNVWNMFNSANLKDLVDGPDNNQPQVPQKLAPPPISSSGTGKSNPTTNSNIPPPPTGFAAPAPPQFANSGPPSHLGPPPSNLGPPPSSNLGPPPTSFGASSHSQLAPPSLKSSSSTGDLRDDFMMGSSGDNSLAHVGHSHSNPGSHSGIPPSVSQPQHRKQHSADASSQPTKTSPTKPPNGTKKSTESEKNLITSVHQIYPYLLTWSRFEKDYLAGYIQMLTTHLRIWVKD